MKFKLNRIGAACLLVASAMACSAGAESLPKVFTDAEIKTILQDRVDRAKTHLGIVVGLVDAKGTRVIAHGKPSLDSSQALDGDSVFEIGSITKIFTDTLMVNMAEKGELSLTDPISKFLPSSVKAPTRKGREISLLNLASHRSGLPRLPKNLAPKNEQNPYVDYTVEQMYAFLSEYKLPRDIGEKFEYSNLGVGLLGHILALKAGSDYETLVRARICQHLGMDDTRITFSPVMKDHLAQGHNELGVPVVNWDIPTLAGAGALRSTTKDLLRFVSAQLGLVSTPLSSSMQKMQDPVHDANLPCIGWGFYKRRSNVIFGHSGGTGGYRTFIGFDRKKGQGVVVLSNSANDVEDIGLHLLESESYALIGQATPNERQAVKVDPSVFDAYVGKYQIEPDYFLTFSREGDKFFAQIGETGKFEIFAESETDFFRNGVKAKVTFVKDGKGNPIHVVLHSAWGDQKAIKVP